MSVLESASFAKPLLGNWHQLALVEGELVGGGHCGGKGHWEGGGEGGEGSTSLQLLDVVAQLSCCLEMWDVRRCKKILRRR